MKKKIAVLFLVFSMVFISCDQEFNTIGADLVGDEHFDFEKREASLKAYSVRTNEVQTNNLPINPLGIYNNPFFGETKANFVTQLALVNPQPKFGTSVHVEDVILYIPFFSDVESTNSDGSKEYTLDSIYGANKESKMKLSVYENGYFINNLDANTDFQDSQRYYSDGSSNGGAIDFDYLKIGIIGAGNSIQGGARLNDSPDVAENDQFFFNKEEIVTYETKFNPVTLVQEYTDINGNVLPAIDQTNPAKWVVKERLAPGIYLKLNKEFFKKKIIESPASNLFNTNKFREYFKGLYFKIEQENIGAIDEGAMAMLNFNKAKLNLNYSSINEGATGAAAVHTSKAFVMNLGTNASGNTVSLQNFAYTGDYNTGLSNPANTFGSITFGQNDRLYVKGGKGSVVYMDVFGDADVLGKDGLPYTDPDTGQPGNKIPDELDLLRLEKVLINDAYLEFYIDRSAMSANSKYQEPERLYLFDATNQEALVDYVYDTSTSSSPKRNKIVHGGIIQRDNTDDKGIKYKIRITRHINNLINSTNENLNKNLRLGLCVTENIAENRNAYYKSPLDINNTPSNLDDDIKFFPLASVLAQQGTVLYGTHPVGLSPEDTEKYRLKLTIHITKPN
ncbi:DUF4270 domain-containing protein [Flavobacterium sp. F372]|uniref:DUF4270 domain-containing protein n=1 Tax=Flavobacterium bernardetii TaxID=2813823 RepID=A0ABR7J0P5_9FLAO|nr:DUF4270 domain-containing protein [Flavobacterium bernardetii]MBC5835605.1 DUF4270 domain-containing protein [Flavobacterium bernardetii]NHF70969.1 DUF4270 domain-containing protein [Flavobacterium bernardetii]